MNDVITKAFDLALQARERSYSPYSKFSVGTAVKAKGNDEIFVGCNIENISYGATICAERVAINNMISKLGKAELEFVIVVADHEPVITPCGICLQVIDEFASKDLPIHLANLKGIQKEYSLGDLLMVPFGI